MIRKNGLLLCIDRVTEWLDGPDILNLTRLSKDVFVDLDQSHFAWRIALVGPSLRFSINQDFPRCDRHLITHLLGIKHKASLSNNIVWLISIMQEYKSSSRILITIFNRISAICVNALRRLEFQCIRLSVTIMQCSDLLPMKNPVVSKSDVIASAMLAVSHIYRPCCGMYTEASIRQLTLSPAILRTIFKLFRDFKNRDSSVASASLSSLINLALIAPIHCSNLRRDGAVEALIEVLEDFPSRNVDMLLYSMLLMRNIAEPSTMSLPSVQAVLTAVIAIGNHFKTDIQYTEAVLDLIVLFGVWHPPGIERDSRVRIVDYVLSCGGDLSSINIKNNLVILRRMLQIE